MGRPEMGEVVTDGILLADLLASYAPGSHDPPWTWDDEEADIFARVCLCCGQPGHYQEQLEAHIAEHGLDGWGGVCLGTDGRVCDGHHRIVAARRLGIALIPLESKADAGDRWVRDHGEVDWRHRVSGDHAPLGESTPWHAYCNCAEHAPAAQPEGRSERFPFSRTPPVLDDPPCSCPRAPGGELTYEDPWCPTHGNRATEEGPTDG